ncbi:toxin glutamine deamidase domain-containing protein, partial [Streptomyces sp. TRM76130]|nr:toxin glutamine deamidase domain-containing protein [Streptomyces sp. TRM76130]
TAAAARTPDPNPDGTPSDRGERAGRNRIEKTLGARFSDLGNGRDAFDRLENTLRDSGHGSQAVILTQDADGRAHAWNAVNHNGRVTYVDAQTGRTSPHPPHSGSNGVFAIPLTADRQPREPHASSHDRPSSLNREPLDGRRSPRQAPANPAGNDENIENQPKKPKKTPAERAAELARARNIANSPLDSSGPEGRPGYGVVQDGDASSVHHNMLGDKSQDLLRVSNTVVQTDLYTIAQHLHTWAVGDPSPLAQTIREAAEHGRLTQNRLNELLRPGFEDMSRADKAATVAAIARLSSAFHDAHAVDDSGGANLHSRHKPTRGDHLDPAPLARRYAATQNLAEKDAQALAENDEVLSESAESKSEQEISRERRVFNKLWNQQAGEAQLNRAIKRAQSEGTSESEIEAMREHRRMMRPDFSGKNYAALEVIEHRPDGSTQIHYITDSSNPPLDHSEPVLGEAFRRLDQENPDRYEAPLMYTEFEPCGNRTHPASANCADYLAHEFERPHGQELKKYHEKTEEERNLIPEERNRTEVVYGAGYRLGDLTPDEMARIDALPPEQRAAETERVRQEAVDARNADMHRFRGELARVWMKLAESTHVP